MTDINVGELLPATLPRPGEPPPGPPQTDVDGGAGAEGRGGGWRVGNEEDEIRKAASEGRTEVVRQLLQTGASLHHDREGRTGLHYAAQNGHAEMCKLLVQEGCALDLQDTMGYTALLRASSQGVLAVVRVLLEAGCAVDFADNHGNTALHEAAWHGFSQTVQLLVKYNADVFRTNQSGFTALHLAAQNGHNESCRVLLYGGINSDLQNNYGDTALHTAARYGHAGVTRILISARCKMNVPNKNGDTALHIAAALKRRKITKILVESGVDIHVRNKQNETAVDVARRKEHPEVILLITSLSRPHSAGPKTREVTGVTFKDDPIKEEKGPVICADDQPSVKPDKTEKERRLFPFFRKKKKEKDDKPSPAPKPAGWAGSGSKVQPVPPKPVSGFFSQYVPRTGTQYYRDLAGNIKQGPVGYTPVCQCGPTLHHIEKSMHQTKEMLYQHIDASHQVLQDRIEQLDQRTSQQAHSLDRLTQERLQQERRACQSALEERLQKERHHTQYVVESYGEGLQGQIQDWLEDRLASYGHCLDHHHDDTALPSSRIFTDVHFGPDGGRLFRSRSDETLSVSDYSGKGKKRHFYESRKAAMEQIRGWKVPTGNRDSSTARRRERGRSTDELDRRRGREESHMDRTRGQGGLVGKGGMMGEFQRTTDRQPDGASPSHQLVKERHVGFSPREEHPPSQGAVPKRSSPSPFGHHPQSRLQTQSRQSRSQGNLPSHTPTALPLSSHLPAGPRPPPRGILRSHTHDAGLHECADVSSRQRPNLEERGPHGDSSGPEPGERGDPCLSRPASTGPAGHAQLDSHRPYGEVHGTALSTPNKAQNLSTAPHAGDEQHRFRPRTRSMDAILDEVDGDRCEEDILNSMGKNQAWNLAAGSREHSGYVTDSGVTPRGADYPGVRQGNVDSDWRGYVPYRPSVPKDRQCGYRSEDGLKDMVKDGSRPVTGGDATRPFSNLSDSGKGGLHDTRPASSERTSGYFTDSEVKHTSPGQRCPTVKPSFHPSPSRQQDNLCPQSQPETRYRVLPPLPPNYVPLSERTKPSVAANKPSVPNKPSVANKPKPSLADNTKGVKPSVCDKGNSKHVAWEKSGSEHSSAKETSSPVTGTKSDGHAAPLNLSSRTRTPSPLCTRGGGARTPGPYQNSIGSGSHSQGNQAKHWDRFSPRDSPGASSGHYSVSRACLQHDSYTDSRPSPRDSKEPSTCSSNQDSGYIDHHNPKNLGEGRSGESTTPSSSFSMDRSSSLGPPSSSGSPYMIMGGQSYGDYVPMGGALAALPPSGSQRPPLVRSSISLGPNNIAVPATVRNSPSVMSRQQQPTTHVSVPPSSVTPVGSNGIDLQGQGKSAAEFPAERQRGAETPGSLIQKQVQGWYHQRLLEAAQRLRNSEQYTQPGDNNNRYTYSTSSDNTQFKHTPTQSGDTTKQFMLPNGISSVSQQHTQRSEDDNKPFVYNYPGNKQYVFDSHKQYTNPHSSDSKQLTSPDTSCNRQYMFTRDSFNTNKSLTHPDNSYSKQELQLNSVYSKPLYTNSTESYSKDYTHPSENYKQHPQPTDSYKQHPQPSNSYKPHPQPSDSYKPHPQPSDSYKQHPQPSDSYKQHPQPSDSYKQHPQPSDSYKQYPQPSDSYKQHPQPSDSYKPHPQPNNSYKPHPQPSNSYKPHPQPSDSYKQHPQPSDSYKQHPQPSDSFKQHPQPGDSYKQHPQPGDSYKQHPQPGDSYKQHPQPSDSYKQHPQPGDSYKQHPQPSDSYKQHPQPSDSYKQHPQPSDSYKQHPQPSDSYKPNTQASDGYRQHPRTSEGYRWYGQLADSGRQSDSGLTAKHYGPPPAESTYRQQRQYAADSGYTNKQYGQAAEGYRQQYGSAAANGKQYAGNFTTIPIRYDPINGSDV